MTTEELVLKGKYLRDEERFEEAYPFFLEAALLDDPEAVNNLGVFYLNGFGVSRDFKKAFHYMRRAYDLSRELAFLYYVAEARLEILADGEAKKLYTAFLEYLLDKQEWDILIIMGREYSADGAYPNDTKKAIWCYEEAVRHGVTVGNELLGEMYFLGTEVEQDFEKAYHYFNANVGFASFTKPYCLGRMYEDGLYVEKDIDRAVQEYESIVKYIGPYTTEDYYYSKAKDRLRAIRLMRRLQTDAEV